MSRRKSFKLHVENIATFNVEGLDFSITRVQIKNGNGTVLKTIPLNLLSQTIVTVESQQQLSVVFSLLEPFSLGARQYRIFAEGSIHVENEQIQSQPIIALGCPIRHIISKKAIISLAVVIKEDVEKITYFIPESEASEIYDESEVDQPPVITTISPQESPRQTEGQKQKKKLSPLKRISKKPVRNRHFEYLVKSESANTQLNNKVTDEESISVENLTFEIDEAVSSIEFYGSTYRQMLAQVLFKTNPSQEDLKHLKIKVPESQKVIDIQLNTLEGGKLYASTNLPTLQENQCLKISCDFKDENNDIKGKIKFHYKENTEKGDPNADKMIMSQEITMFQKHKLKDQLQFLPFLFSDQKVKVEEPFKLKLPKISKKEQKFAFQTIINQKIKPDDESPKYEQQFSNRSGKLANTQSRQQHKHQNEIDRIHRSKTIHSRSQIRPESPRIYSPNIQSQKNMIRITGVSVKFYKSYIERNHNNLQKQPFTGKFLQIYSNPNNIYRSSPAFANSTLNWKLLNCEIQITEYDNLTIQLNLEKQKTLLGELVISYNQLKFNQEENFLYFGYLTKDYDTIAKICLEFMLAQLQVQEKQRASVLQRTQRRTRMKRLYSEDIAYIGGDQLMKKEKSNKVSLYESLAIPTIPEKIHADHRARLCEQQRQIQLIRQRKRNKPKSPYRKEKYF